MAKNKNLLIFLLFSVLGFILYMNTLKVGFVFDSVSLKYDPQIRDIFSALKDVFLQYSSNRRLAYFTFAINYLIGRENPIGYHIFNIIIHILTAFTVYKFLEIFTKKEKASFFAALIFLVNPIQTQALNLIVQRMVLLSGLFYFLTLYLYLKNRETDKKRYYILAIISFLAGIRCKEIVITLPLVLTFIDYKNIKKIIPFYFIAFLPILFKIMVALNGNNQIGKVFNMKQANADLTRGKYFISEFKVIVYYIALILLPLKLRIDYDFKVDNSFFNIDVLFPFFILLVLIFLIIYLYKKKFLYSFSIFLFFMGIFVTSTIIPIEDLSFEHRVYISSVGVILFITLFIDEIIKSKIIKNSIFIIILLIYSGLTINRNFEWKNESKLWKTNIKYTPNKVRPRYNLVEVYLKEKKYNLALEEIDEILKIDNYYEAYKDRAKIYLETGDYNKALKSINIAISRYNKDIENYEIKIKIFEKLRKLDKIEETALKSLEIEKSAKMYNYLAEANYIRKNYNKAIKFANLGLEVKNNYRGNYLLGNISMKFSKYDKAINYFEQCVKIGRMDSKLYKRLKWLYQITGKKDKLKLGTLKK
ncbi:glycosyltransferase family 39 protein [Haliovirga abyssi]|uniref:Glycosyltransferase RgtA/B/C/D-like domain-containing protein n=1 Tax=Haliovirga abyssi TaxID=2996794 RepID=A0AAU9DM99_9FUSO|nr:glycosyltransferase family 39 protein [Haliovirga abyssi]BDU51132.1 hypothetical protein HLVA_17010 [Haliovirga abyssi]